jgi:hypothetical protein
MIKKIGLKMVSDSLNSFTKEIITKTVRLRLLSCGIIHYTYLPGSDVCKEEHLANHHALIELVGKEKKFPVLMDASEFIIVTPEARKLVRELEPIIPVNSRAFVIKSLSQRIATSFYIRLHKPLVPTKIFTKYEEAYDWLNEKK